MIEANQNIPDDEAATELSGWLIFLAGLGLLVSLVLIPANLELEAARLERDRALAAESHELTRIGRYSLYLEALDRGDETLLQSLAMSQLQLAPADRAALLSAEGPLPIDLFGPIEPTHTPVSRQIERGSLLERLATDSRARLWLLAGAGMLLFLGVLPSNRSAA